MWSGQGQYEEAEEAFRRVLELDPDNQAATISLAEALLSMGRLREALDGFDRVLERDPIDKAAALGRAEALRNLGRYEEAEIAFRRVLELDPDNQAATIARADALRTMGRFEEALGGFDRVLERDPDNEAATVGMARALHGMSRFEEALGGFRRALELDPDNEAATIGQAQALQGMGRHREALDGFDRVLERDPDNEAAALGRAEALCDLGRYEEAEVAFRRVLDLDPDNEAAAIGRAESLRSLGSLDEASDVAGAAVARHRDSAASWSELGRVRSDQGRREEAEEAFRDAVGLDRDSEAAIIGWAQALRGLGRLDEASDVAGIAVARHPDSAASWSELGRVRSDQGRREEAEKAFRDALELDPSNMALLAELSRLRQSQASSQETEGAFQPVLEPETEVRQAAEGSEAVLGESNQLRALIRDERRLTLTLEDHKARLFDVETSEALRDHVSFALETMEEIAVDDDMWRRLEDAARAPVTAEQRDRLSSLPFSALPPLLEAAGYHCPPPPPADDLVVSTHNAIVAAFEESRDPRLAAARVRTARWHLDTFNYRVRRQIRPSWRDESLEPGRLRGIALKTGQAIRWLIPRVAGATTGALVESQTPGAGAGAIAGKTAQRVAEDFFQMATQAIVGKLPFGTDMEAPELESIPEPEPVPAHVAKLFLALDDVRKTLQEAKHISNQEDVREFIRANRSPVGTAERHLERVRELLIDRDSLSQELVSAIDEVAGQLAQFRQLLSDGTVTDLQSGSRQLTEVQLAAAYLRERLRLKVDEQEQGRASL
jgi:tetratricopeptide (TPR) repeat protein